MTSIRELLKKAASAQEQAWASAPIWYGVFCTQCVEPSKPVAIFEELDPAIEWAYLKCQGKGWQVSLCRIFGQLEASAIYAKEGK